MRNVCRRKQALQQRPVHWWFCVLLVLGFTAGLAVDARSEYVRPTTEQVTSYLAIGGEELLNLSRVLISVEYFSILFIIQSSKS